MPGGHLRWLFFSMEGRVSRGPWWLGTIGLTVLGELLGLLPLPHAGAAASALLLVPHAFLDGKRLHDTNRSAWWQAPVVLITALAAVPGAPESLDRLLNLGPMTTASAIGLGLIFLLPLLAYLIILAFQPGTPGPNRFDEEQRTRVADVFS